MLELPVTAIAESDRYPDRDARYIFEHLKYVCSLPSPFPLPAVVIDVVDGRCIVTAGHKYLRIARELGRSHHRCIVQRNSSHNEATILALVPGGARVAPDILQQEQNAMVVPDYHVYFFHEPLTHEEQTRFRSEIAGFFERLQSPLLKGAGARVAHCAFPFEGRCAEFTALVPVGDSSWFGAYRELSRRFSREVKKIWSFQGAHFVD
jgi:hypothetical protein